MRISDRVKLLKPISLLLAAIIFFTAALAGCGKDEISLLSAIMSAPQMLSYEYEGSAKVELKFDVYEHENVKKPFAEPVEYYRTIEEMVNGAGVNINMKANSNKENTKSKVEMLITPMFLNTQLDNMSMGVWADVDLENPVWMKEYIKLPKALTMNSMWDQMKKKEYISVTSDDINKVLQMADAGIDLDALLDPQSIAAQNAAGEIFTQTMNDIFIRLAGLLDTKSAYILGVDEDGAGGNVYHVKITDEGLKDLFFALSRVNRADMKAIGRSLLTAFSDYMKDSNMGVSMYPYGIAPESIFDEVLSEYDAAFNELYPDMIEALQELEKIAKRVKLLGNDGITLDISVSKDGFVTGVDGAVDFVLDLRNYTIAAGDRFTDTLRKVTVKLTFSNNFTNINKDIVVNMPSINGRNTLSITDLLESLGNSGLDFDMFY